MNKLSGYTHFILKDGRHIEFKVCNGTYALFGKKLNLATAAEVTEALRVPMKEVKDESTGEVVEVPNLTFDYQEKIQLFVFCAAEYAALAQNKPVDFTIYDVVEWLEEIGEDAILSGVEQPSEKEVAEAKKKRKKPLIKATQ